MWPFRVFSLHFKVNVEPLIPSLLWQRAVVVEECLLAPIVCVKSVLEDDGEREIPVQRINTGEGKPKWEMQENDTFIKILSIFNFWTSAVSSYIWAIGNSEQNV